MSVNAPTRPVDWRSGLEGERRVHDLFAVDPYRLRVGLIVGLPLQQQPAAEREEQDRDASLRRRRRGR